MASRASRKRITAQRVTVDVLSRAAKFATLAGCYGTEVGERVDVPYWVSQLAVLTRRLSIADEAMLAAVNHETLQAARRSPTRRRELFAAVRLIMETT